MKFSFKYFSEIEMDDRHLCEPCSSENNRVQATHFCKTCADPELLCESCAKHHTKQKSFKDHELSNDIGDFQKRYWTESVKSIIKHYVNYGKKTPFLWKPFSEFAFVY